MTLAMRCELVMIGICLEWDRSVVKIVSKVLASMERSFHYSVFLNFAYI